MAELTAGEMEARLNEGHVAHLVTLKRDGSPHVAPVWYRYDSERVYVIAHESAVKVRNIRRDHRVAVSIASDTEPYWYVLFEGTATVTTQDVERVTLAICVRYRGQERGTRYARDLLHESTMVAIEITPTRVIAWRNEA